MEVRVGSSTRFVSKWMYTLLSKEEALKGAMACIRAEVKVSISATLVAEHSKECGLIYLV
jgi:hypothetical protein